MMFGNYFYGQIIIKIAEQFYLLINDKKRHTASEQFISKRKLCRTKFRYYKRQDDKESRSIDCFRIDD